MLDPSACRAIVACAAIAVCAWAERWEPTSIFVGQALTAERPSDSDHSAILFTFHAAGGPVRLLSWNTLCQYGYNQRWGYPYDGYNRRAEADSDYVDRLARTAAQVVGHVGAYRPQAVLLQEAPEPDSRSHGAVAERLRRDLSHWGYTVLHAGEFVTAVQGASSEIKLPDLPRQHGKMHAVFCPDLNTVILNMHLAYDAKHSWDERATRQDLESALAHVRAHYPLARVFLAGDTNRVPATSCEDPNAATIEQLTDGLGLLCYPPGPTNVRWDAGTRRSRMAYADFALHVTPPGSSPQ